MKKIKELFYSAKNIFSLMKKILGKKCPHKKTLSWKKCFHKFSNIKKNPGKKFQLFLHIFTDRLKKHFHPAKKFCKFFHTWKNKQNWQTHFPDQKKKKKKMNFVSQKKLSWQNFSSLSFTFSQTEEKIRERFYPAKNILFMQTSSDFFLNFFSHMKNKFSSEKKGSLEIHSFHPVSDMEKVP